MIKRRLYLQIYVTILSSLFLVAVSAIFAWHLFGRDRSDNWTYENATRMAMAMLPPADAPRAEQNEAIQRLATDLDIGLSLFAADRTPIARHGNALELPENPGRRWQRYRDEDGPYWVMGLPDGRWLALDLNGAKNPVHGVLLFISCMAFGIGLASYPFVRKLTGRLERLQSGVELVGSGDLSARVAVEGRDEVAGLARSFNSTAERLEALVTSQRLLLANTSHELRTPLARIRMGIEMLDRENAEERREALKRDIAELDILIEELLVMTRLESDRRSEAFRKLDFLALVAEECARYRDCTLCGISFEVNGDPSLLQRMVRNLLDNAQKHGRPPLAFRMVAEGDDVLLTVDDAGPGIPEDMKDRLFEPFARGRDRQNVPGSGLGLALVRQIAETHGGHVDLRPRPAGNWQVAVTLPGLPPDNVDGTSAPDR